MNLIVVYNCCGISGKESVDKYVGRIRNLVEQRNCDFRVVVSMVRNSMEDQNRIIREFGNKVSYNFIDSLITVNQSFNHTCIVAAKHLGVPEGFLYVDQGCDTATETEALRKLWEGHKSGNYAMTAAMPSNDEGFPLWFPGQTEETLFNGKDVLVIPVGKTTNLHFQIFDKSLVTTFGRPLPDIFAAFSTESVFSFVCAAIGKRMGLWRNVRIQHEHTIGTGSAGFLTAGVVPQTQLVTGAPKTIAEIIADPEAKALGLGFEECQSMMMHDPECYDQSGQHKFPPRLFRYIRDNLYLPSEGFDYNEVWHVFKA